MKWLSDTFNWEGRKGDYHDLNYILSQIDLPILFIIGDAKEDYFNNTHGRQHDIESFESNVLENTDHNRYMKRPQMVSFTSRDLMRGRTINSRIRFL